MISRRLLGMALLVAVVAPSGVAFAQTARDEPVAFVTAVSGAGAVRRETGQAFPVVTARISDADSGLLAGQGVRTREDGTAIVTLPAHGIVVRLDESSELAIVARDAITNGIPVSLHIRAGSALILSRPDDSQWLLAVGESATAPGYTLFRGASLAMTVGAEGVTFATTSGNATCFAGRVPAGPLIDDSNELMDESGVGLPEGQSVSTTDLARLESDRISGSMAAGMYRDMYAFGLRSSEGWVRDAERGDFTPVRGAARGAPEVLPGQMGTELAFDQPRSIVATPAPRVINRPMRSTTVASTTLQQRLQSGVPTSVVIGQRIRRTRIIGNPGSTSGQIRFNPQAEQLIRLPRR